MYWYYADLLQWRRVIFIQQLDLERKWQYLIIKYSFKSKSIPIPINLNEIMIELLCENYFKTYLK